METHKTEKGGGGGEVIIEGGRRIKPCYLVV